MLSAQDAMKKAGFDKCPECDCNVGDDWEYTDHSGKGAVVCSQCETRFFLGDEG